ncbi:MAG: PHP domain-containing protein [Syntrophales bacterium]
MPGFSARAFKLCLFVVLSGSLFAPYSALGQTPPAFYKQTPALIDVRTTFSDGAYDPETIARMARERGIGVVFLNDHDRMAMEYGLPPFRNILKKRVELNSINKAGADRYLAAVAEAGKKYPDMVIVPGAESAPFYYWTGSPFSWNLTANDHERRILTMGLERAEDYQSLPVLHNDRVSSASQKWSGAAMILSLLLSIALLFGKGWWRFAGAVIAAADVFFILGAFFSAPSLFDPYHGPQGVKPYQHFLDAVSRRGGLTFWNYPETRSGTRKMGPVYVSTLPYPQMLLETVNYTGFSALYGDNITATEPGGLWDRALLEYCRGFRRSPPWGIATSDYHEEGESGQKLGDFQTVLLLSEQSGRAALEALRNGRMYARQGNFPRMPRLDEFNVSDSEKENVRPVVSGGKLVLRGNPRIRISLSGSPEGKAAGKLRVRLIRSGELIQVFSGEMPMKIDYVDRLEKPGETIYYRADMQGYGKIVSNPIFVEFAK